MKTFGIIVMALFLTVAMSTPENTKEHMYWWFFGSILFAAVRPLIARWMD